MTVRIAGLDEIMPTLVRHFADGDGVIWTGAGVSATRDDPSVGVPGVESLKGQLGAELSLTEGAIAALDLENVSGRYVQKFGRAQLDMVLRQLYSDKVGVAPAFYGELRRLPPDVATFVTTNYDPYLEQSLEGRDPVVIVRERNINAVSHARPVIYKPHGDAADPATCVITTTDYDDWMSESTDVSAVIATLFLQRTVVAVGYRAQDAHFRGMIRQLARRGRERGDARISVYVAIPSPRAEDFSEYIEEGIDLIALDATGETLVPRLASELVRELQQREFQRLEALSEPASVRTARAALNEIIGSTTRAGMVPSDVHVIERARLRLAGELAESGNHYGAMRELSGIAQECIARGDANATARYVEALRFGVSVLRDASYTDTMRRNMLVWRQGIGAFPIPADAEALDLTELVRIREGNPLALVGHTEYLARLAVGGQGSDDSVTLERRHAVLSAEWSLTSQSFEAAGRAFTRAATVETNEAKRAEYEIRGLWASGKGGGLEAALTALDTAAYPASAEALRWRAYGWLAAEGGVVENALAAFERAARVGISQADVVGAAAAYGGIVWAKRFATGLSFDYSVEQRAYDAKRALVEHGRFTGVPRLEAADALLRRADAAIQEERWHDGMREAWAALRLAYEDLDTLTHDEALERLARVWPALLREKPEDNWSQFWAAATLMDAHSTHETARKKLAASLLEAIQGHTSDEERGKLIARISDRALGAAGLVGALRVVQALLPAIDSATANAEATALLLRACTYPWSASARTDPRRIAVEVMPQLAARLSSEVLAKLRDAWFAMLWNSPPQKVEATLIGLANTLYRGDPPLDDGVEMLQALLPWLEPLQQDAHTLTALLAVLAMLVRRAPQPLASEARLAMLSLPNSARWLAADRLLEAGVDVEDAMLSEYLAETIERIRAVTVDGNPAVISFGAISDLEYLSDAAVHRIGGPELLEAAQAVADLLNHDAQHAELRVPWIHFAWRLARYSDACRTILSPTLLRLAQGRFTTPRTPWESNATHPLTSFRLGMGGSQALRLQALRVLAALYSVSLPADQFAFEEALANCANDAEALTRVLAQNAIEQLFQSLGGGMSEVDVRAVAWSLEALGDAEPSVREAALSALERRARVRSRAPHVADATS